MGRRLNWVISAGATVGKGGSRKLRGSLAATTILVAVPFMGYGRPAFAACDPSPAPPTFVCSGDTVTTQNINADDADVSTAPGFSLTAPAGDGINVTADGHLQFTDDNNSPITSTAGTGLFVHSTGNSAANDGAVIIDTNGNITGDLFGIYAWNEGDGAIEITVDGQVTGYDADGIYADNQGENLTITTGAASVVRGDERGIRAYNDNGNLEITVDGQVTGYDQDGIYATNYGDDLTVTTGAQSSVTGYENGINASNYGVGDLEIEANGQVTGYDEDGIFAKNYGDDLTVTTGAQSNVHGDENGIDARNYGYGDLEIEANGQVTGNTYDGIYALNGTDGGNLTITTGAQSVVVGGGNGIGAYNHGYGNLEITANGVVTGQSDGIYAYNDDYGDLTVETGAQSVITGVGGDGIDARNYTEGNLEITANGQVVGDNNGIEAHNSSNGLDLTVTTGIGSAVTGAADGIDTEQYGDGDIEITVNGSVTGQDEAGIDSANYGEGDTVIKVGAAGLVQGYYAGIDAYSDGGQDIEITNDGTVRNLSGESHYLAIATYGGATDIENNGDLIGTVTTDLSNAYDDTLDNTGLWNPAGGDSDFGDGEDVVSNSGTLLAADDPTEQEETDVFNLEDFVNSGLVSLVDGQEGDHLHLNDGADYEGDGGTLAVDAVLGPDEGNRLSDELFVGGNSSGTTLVHVNVLEATGANTEGIPVVEVDGSTDESHFDLDGPLNAGFFTWDLRRDGDVHELYTSGIGVGSYEFAAGIGGAQEVWHQTTGTLLQRQADLRTLLGTGVTPVADYAEPVAPSPVARITPGFWFRGVGAWIDRDDEENGFTLDRKQTIWGGLGGFDFGTQDVGDALMFGLFGGYLTSDLDFKETNSEWTYEGPTVGAYVTYLDHAFYVDATVKADFLNIDIDPDDLSPGSDDADTDGLNIGGRIDTGYKFGETFFLEPQATLAVVHTDIDDVDIYGGTVEFDNETSVRGRLGLRVGFDQPTSEGTIFSGDVTASAWQDFSGDNDVTIVDTGIPSFGASVDPGQTYGDVALGFSVAAADGWSGFIRGNYLFASDYEAVTGNAGVRYAW